MSRSPRGACLVVALDVGDPVAALAAAGRLRNHVDLVKVGLELFTAGGPSLVRSLHEEGLGVFLDLKIHDIPATAAGAVRVATELGVELLTLHASGGVAMLAAAAEARGTATRPRLMGVTVLTSLDGPALARLGWQQEPRELVDRLGDVAREGGCDGVVASVHEAQGIKQRFGNDFAVVTPGIRPPGAGVDDQARVATPAAAVAAGSDYLVVGRPILRAADPAAAAAEIRAQMESAVGQDGNIG